MRRVLIVDESEMLVQIITKACFGDDEVRFCADGNTALALLAQYRPDLLVINMSLPYKDGLTVLRQAAFLPRQVLAISYLTDPYILRELGALGVQYVLHMPTPSGVRQALKTMANMESGIRADLRSAVVEHLHRLKIPTNLDGYRMLVVGLPLFYKDLSQPLGKELYPAIICALGQGSEQTVERSMRQTIKAAWKNRTDSVWTQYFPPNSRGVIPCPSTKKFLTVLARQLQQEFPNQ